MNTPDAYITPSVLRWARKTCNYGTAQAAEELDCDGITEKAIIQWENGDTLPSFKQLEKLAKLYGRPTAVFFLLEPPKERGIERFLSSLPEREAKSLPPKLMLLIRKAVARKINLSELNDGTPPSSFEKLLGIKANTNTDVVELAKEFRKLLGISFDMQKSWGDAAVALEVWRKKLDNFGFWVLLQPFGKELARYNGFLIPDDKFPIVILNASKKSKTQISALFHEIGHFLLKKGGITYGESDKRELAGSYKNYELFCNSFADEMLAPKSDLNFSARPSFNEIKHFSLLYQAPHKTIRRQFRQKSPDQNNRITKAKRTTAEIMARYGIPQDIISQRNLLGKRYIELAFKRYRENQITEDELAEYLDIQSDSLQMLEQSLHLGED